MNTDNRVYITWEQVQARTRELITYRFNKVPFAYGVPRGGQPISALLLPVDSPDKAEVIVDDLCDSGATEAKYKALYPDTPFIALFDKRTEPDIAGKWLVFPWEKEEPEFGDATEHFRRILQRFGFNMESEGLARTPERYIRFMEGLLKKDEFNFTTFDSNGYDEMIVETGIPFYSLCEHHTLPFFGTACIGYIPKSRIAGLSKLPRTVQHFAGGLQNQERLTQQIADFLAQKLGTNDVAVVIKARHLCMEMRGAKSVGTSTTTSTMKGVFRTDDKCRAEFLQIIKA